MNTFKYIMVLLMLALALDAVADDVDLGELREQFKNSADSSGADGETGFVVVEDDELEQATKDLLQAEEELLKQLSEEEKARFAGQDDKAIGEDKLEDKKASLKIDKNSTKKKKAKKSKTSSDTSKELGALKSKNSSLSSKVSSQSKSISSLRRTNSSLTRQLNEAKARIRELQKQYNEAESRLILSETEVERLSGIIEKQNRKSLARYSKTKKTTAPKRQAAPKPFANKATKDMPIASVIVAKANLRTGPGKSHSPLMSVSRGTRLAVEAREGSWYRVIAPTGKRVWVSSEVIAFGSNPKARPSRTVQVKGFDAGAEGMFSQK